ncbi:uncharacterized protein RJT21DRAFT_118368 [Scheffersomyces amazonensis]|uniref:uncharacterized protein n=1 Tax=Scheffersomyces amazonensis TaxID=1078765 RepID=UPI00315CB4BE
MVNNQSLQVLQGPYDSENVTNKIQSLLNQIPLISNANIITNSSDYTGDDIVSSSFYYTANNYNSVYELLTSIKLERDENVFYVKAIPSDVVVVDNSLSSLNVNQLSLHNSKLIFILTESTFQTIPALTNKVKNSRTRKLKHTKIGHGAKQFVSYNYQIDIDLIIDHGKFNIEPEIAYIINKEFSQVQIEVSSSFTIDYLTEFASVPQFKHTTIDPTTINLQPFEFNDINNNLGDIYEYFTLLTLNSTNPQLQLTNSIDDALSSYQIPSSSIDTNQSSPSVPLYKHNIINVNSHYISHTILSQSWKLLSLQTSGIHVIIYRDTKDNTFVFEAR